MEAPFLFPIEPNEFYNRIKQLIEKILEERLSAKQSLVPPPNGLTSKPLLSLKEVCNLFAISKPTLYDWVAEKRLKPYKIGGKVYFLQNDISDLLNHSRKLPD